MFARQLKSAAITVKYFFLGYKVDSTHLFNIVYFVISIVAIF
jgi:hypothetical protein